MADKEKDKLLAEWFWTDRWTGSSGFLLPIEPRGLYREMLTQAWRRKARLPNDHEAIRRAVAVSEAEWDRCWPKVQPYWRVEGDYLVNDTQLEVYREALAARDAAIERARYAAEERWKRERGKPKRRKRPQSPSNAHASREQSRSNAPDLLEQCPPSPSPSPIASPERSPERISARGLAFAGRVLQVPRFLDAEFVGRLNGHYFDLTAFYVQLDARLQQSGETWDLRWIREQFAAATPQPERRQADRPFTERELAEARNWYHKMGGCEHQDGRCQTAEDCQERFIRERLRLEKKRGAA